MLAIQEPVAQELDPLEPKLKDKTDEELIHSMANQYKEVESSQLLVHILEIDHIARSHSEDLAERNYKHDIRGADSTDKGTQQGMVVERTLTHTTHLVWQRTYSSMTGWYRPLSGEIMKGWMNSLDYQQNIMKPSYDRIDVGAAIGNHNVYVTQNFC